MKPWHRDALVLTGMILFFAACFVGGLWAGIYAASLPPRPIEVHVIYDTK